MTNLTESFSIWMHREFTLTSERYTELSQTLTIHPDGMFELRWVDYTQGSALEETPNDNHSDIMCMVGSILYVSDTEYELDPKHLFRNFDDVTQETQHQKMVVMANDENKLTIANPLISDPRFNNLSKVN